MIYLAAVLVVLIGLVVIARSQRGVPRLSLTTTAILAGALIAVIRLGLFCGALTLYGGSADPRQGAGHLLLILNSLPELAIAAALSGHPGAPPLVAVLITLTSAALGWLLAWIRFQAASANGPDRRDP